MKTSFTGSETITLLNRIIDIPNYLHGENYLIGLAKNLWEVFEFDCILMGYAVGEDKSKIQTVVNIFKGQLADNFIYNLDNSPCSNVYSGERVFIHRENVSDAFPRDTLLADMNIQSYIGAPTIVNGDLLGIVALLDTEPLESAPYFESLVEFVASRAGLELERVVNQIEMQALRQQASRDPLTGVLNRREFEVSSIRLLQRFNKTDFAILFVDADNFKNINDMHGHHFGDEVLKMLAKVLQACIRQGDLLARWGGEEFIILLPNADAATVIEVSDRIHDRVRGNPVHPVTVSIGAAIGSEGSDFSDVIDRADIAMYKAKESGKNRTRFSQHV